VLPGVLCPNWKEKVDGGTVEFRMLLLDARRVERNAFIRQFPNACDHLLPVPLPNAEDRIVIEAPRFNRLLPGAEEPTTGHVEADGNVLATNALTSPVTLSNFGQHIFACPVLPEFLPELLFGFADLRSGILAHGMGEAVLRLVIENGVVAIVVVDVAEVEAGDRPKLLLAQLADDVRGGIAVLAGHGRRFHGAVGVWLPEILSFQARFEDVAASVELITLSRKTQ